MSDSTDTRDETADETEQPAGSDRSNEPTQSGMSAAPALREGDDETVDGTSKDGGSGRRNVLSYLEWAGLGLCVILVLVAGLRVYWGVGAFISLWVASKYEPIVSAGFNLAVLLLAAYGIAVLSRRLTATT